MYDFNWKNNGNFHRLHLSKQFRASQPQQSIYSLESATMFGNKLIRNSMTYLMGKAGGQRWVSGSATANRLQAKALQETALAENCILVDEHDRAIGQSTKRDCHRVDENGHIKLHRAFSVFLFNSNGDMLIQKRSSHKVRHTGIYSQRNLHHFKATAVFSIDFFCVFFFCFFAIKFHSFDTIDS